MFERIFILAGIAAIIIMLGVIISKGIKCKNTVVNFGGFGSSRVSSGGQCSNVPSSGVCPAGKTLLQDLPHNISLCCDGGCALAPTGVGGFPLCGGPNPENSCPNGLSCVDASKVGGRKVCCP